VAKLGVASHRDRIEAVKSGRAFAHEREKLFGRQKKSGRRANGDRVDIGLLAEHELDFAHGLARDARGQHDAAPAFARDHRDLARHDEMQTLRLFAVSDELFAPLERASLQPLDQVGALRRGDCGDEGRRPPEVGDRVASAESGELDPELGVPACHRLDRASSHHEENRCGGRSHRSRARQVRHESHLADERAAAHSPEHRARPAAALWRTARNLEVTRRHDKRRARVLAFLKEPVPGRNERRLQGF
jgi:hypothetical protein